MVLEAEKTGGSSHSASRKGGKREDDQALVLAALDEGRGVYVVVGLGGNGEGGIGRVRSKAEMREREELRKRKEADKAARKAERARVREERRALRRERLAANGDLDSEDEGEESDATESDVSSSDSDSDSDSDKEDEGAGDGSVASKRRKGPGRNRFGQAFQEVVESTGARVRIDSFEHCVVEVRKEDLMGFLEGLSLRSVVG